MDITAFYFSCKYQIIKISKIKAKIGFVRVEYELSLKNECPMAKKDKS